MFLEFQNDAEHVHRVSTDNHIAAAGFYSLKLVRDNLSGLRFGKKNCVTTVPSLEIDPGIVSSIVGEAWVHGRPGLTMAASIAPLIILFEAPPSSRASVISG